jgi:shikimate dehydrogenase
MPHKEDAAAACDELTPDAAALRSVNTVVRRPDGTLLGASTDGEGFLRSLADADVDPEGVAVLVVGAGGAARAVAQALGRVGASVTVAARRSEAAAAAAALAPGGRAVAMDGIPDALAGCSIVVQSTPLGMDGTSLAFDPDGLGPDHVVCDLVYHPAVTPLLAAAATRGARRVGGIGMLLHQAALAFELQTGMAAPIDAMRDALAEGDATARR